MAKTINKYATKAAFDADEAARTALNKTNISFIVETNRVNISGKNILREYSLAQKGDALVFSKTANSLVCIVGASYEPSLLGSDFIDHKIVCVGERGDEVFFAPKDVQAGQMFGFPDVWKLDGFDLENGGSFTITIKDSDASAGKTSVSNVTYAAGSTVADILAQITVPSSNTVKSAVGDYIRIQVTGWSASCGITVTTSGSEQAVRHNPERYQMGFNPEGMSVLGNVKRNKGLPTYFAGGNFKGFKNYYSVSGSEATNLGENSTDILRQSAFNSTDNPTLYNKFGGDYDAYLMSEMAKWPDNDGCLRNWAGKSDTDILNGRTFTDIDADATLRYGFPAAHAAKVFGYADTGYTTGLEAGNWHLPDINAMYTALKDVDFNTYADRFAKTVIKMGGNAHQVRSYYRWASSLASGIHAWSWYTGCSLRAYHRGSSYSVWPFLALKKS